jgi:nicotinamide mononucleotide adenylyltransferase
LKEYFKKHVINARGKRTSKKVLVIESDDWGSIRIPNKEAQEYLAKESLIISTDPFSAFDCLECADDYEALFEVLMSHKDKYGNHPVITTNMVMANPDFDKIKENKFQSFYLESFAKTYEEYYPNQQTFEVLKNGINQKLIYPQFHAREHLNVLHWLKRLQTGDERFLKAFDVNCFAIDDLDKGNNRANLMASYDYQYEEELYFVKKSIAEGLQLFEQTFGFTSKTTIAPCYIWNESIEDVLNQHGVKSLQSSYIQQKNSNGQHQRIWQKMGRTNKLDQRYFVRNVLFEPALSKNIHWVDKALESIAIAFFWGKPAVVGSHRINYVAGLSIENRDNTLSQLTDLLKKVVNKWPDIEFINSEQLLELYS